MGFIIGVLVFTTLVVSVILVLLILVQHPKRETGAGVAFGGDAKDALFGAGSGTALTKIMKYAAAAFLILAVLLSVLETRFHSSAATQFLRSPAAAATTPR